MIRSNHFIESLSPTVRKTIEGGLEVVTLKRNVTLVDIGKPVVWVYLPIDSIISVTTVMENGDHIESRTIGREGGFGLLHALGSRLSFERVIVQVGGQAYRIKAADLQNAATGSLELNTSIVRHAQATIVQSAQFLACNTLHATGPRLARWLLMTQDRLQAEVVPLTQEHLAIMLGVQRTTVTALASAMQDNGLISYSRGKIMVKDRDGLKRTSCECYAAVTGSVAAILKDASAELVSEATP